MTQKQQVKAHLQRWYRRNHPKRGAFTLRHVYPRAFVIGHCAPGCLVVAVPWLDSEPQCREFDRLAALKTVRVFDAALKAGDWCAVAYASSEHVGELIAAILPDVKP